MDKKIGLLTFHRAVNYGAILQAFSLNRYLTKNGCKVTLLDYYPKNDEESYSIFRSWFHPKGLLYNLLVLPYFKRLREKKNKFSAFLTNHFAMSERFETANDMQVVGDTFDCLITGSDQVFNPISKENIKAYYLTFSDKPKRVAYAPSFGLSSFDAPLQSKLTPLLQKFSALSCRETKGAEFIAECTGKDCPVVIDPVYLTSAEEWAVIADTKIEDKSYIFVYDLNGRERLLQMAYELKKKTGMPIICLTTKKYCIGYDVDKLVVEAGPKDFLKLIAEARYVLTDSFHGLSFSIIFRKPFLSTIAVAKSSERITNILSIIDEIDRIVPAEQINTFDYSIIDRPMNYQKELEAVVINSCNFLKTNVL